MRALVLLVCLTGSARAADPPKKDAYGDPLPEGALLRLGTTRARDLTLSCGVRPDGTVVTVNERWQVRVWGPTAERPGTTITLPVPKSQACFGVPQVSPNGRYVAARTERTVLVWEAPRDAAGRLTEVAVFEIPNPDLLRFSPDGTRVAVAGVQAAGNNTGLTTVQVCDLKARAVLPCELGSRGYLEHLQFSGDGKRLVAGGGDRLYFWDATTGKQLAHWKTQGHFYSVALDETGNRLTVQEERLGTLEERWRCYDPRSGKELKGLIEPPDGGTVTAGPRGTLWVPDRTGVCEWNPKAGKVVRHYAAPPLRFARHPVLSPDGKVLVAHNRYLVCRWNAETGEPLFRAQTEGHGGPITGLGASPDGKRIVTRGDDERLIAWDATTGARLWDAPARESGPDIDFAPDGRLLVAADIEQVTAAAVDAATGKVLRRFALHPDSPDQGGFCSLRLAPDGKVVVGLTAPRVARDPGMVTCWSAATGERLGAMRLNERFTFGGRLSRDGRLLDLGFGVVKALGTDPNPLAQVQLPISAMPGDFTPNGNLLVQMGVEPGNGVPRHAAVVVSTTTWEAVFTVPLAGPGRAAVSPDGRTLATVCGEKLVLHDVATGKELCAYRIPPGDWDAPGRGWVTALRFTADGTKLITGRADTTALVWPVPARAK